MGKKLLYLVIHCTDTPEGRVVTKEDIFHWHTSPVSKGGRGWSKPGYSDMIGIDGSLINLRSFDTDDEVDPWEITNGAIGLNGIARHVVYAGGKDKVTRKPKDTRTPEQLKTLETYVKYQLLRHPGIQVMGHGQAPNTSKTCPNFNVAAWLRSIGISEKNIYTEK